MQLAGWGSKKDLGGAEGEESKIRTYFIKNCSIIKEKLKLLYGQRVGW